MEEDIELTSAGFKPLKNLQGALVYKIAVFGLIIQMLLSVTSIISSTMQISFLQKVQDDYYESESEMEQAAISSRASLRRTCLLLGIRKAAGPLSTS